MRRLILTLIISLISILHAQEEKIAPVNLDTVPSYQRGLSALADNLPEQAVIRLKEAYSIKGLTNEQNQTILIKLAEAQVRSNMPAEALKTISNKFLIKYPTVNFWKGQALAANGEFTKAIEILTSLDPKSNNYPQAILTSANLAIAIGNTTQAITLLEKAATLKSTAIQLRAKITLTELHIENNQLEKAKLTLKKTTNPTSLSLQQYLKAKSAYKEGKFAESIAIYRQLIDSSENLPKRIFDLTLLGLIDARHSSGDTIGSITETIETIKNHKDASTLPQLLNRLSTWLPADIVDTDKNLLQLRDWAGRAPNPNAPISFFKNSDSVIQIPPSFGSAIPQNAELKSLSQFYYSKLLSKSSSPGSLDKALFELSVFQITNPGHPLFANSLILTAQNQLKKKDPEAALISLSSIQQLADTEQITLPLNAQSQAAFMRGMLHIKNKNYSEALKDFKIASDSNNDEFTKNSNINAGLAALRSADLEAFKSQQLKITDTSLQLELEIEKSLWLAQTYHPEARSALNTFILANPTHPRITEVRIALASICATQSPIDPLMCRALLSSIPKEKLTEEQFTEFTKTSYQLATVTKNWPDAIAITEAWLTKYPSKTQSKEFTMRKGISLYRNGEHNKARQILGQLAHDHPKSELTPFANYYSAMAARLEATPQAQLESVKIFEKVIKSSSPIAIEARIQQARILIDLDQIPTAVKSLKTTYKKKSTTPQQREIAILLADAYHRQGSSDSAKYQLAIDIYDDLISSSKLSLAWSNRIHFLKGEALEGTGTEESNKAALDTYYQVLNRENLPKNSTKSEQEWKWFYRCSFKALSMLEKNNRPRAAIAIAKKIASYKGGPRAKEAAERARFLEKEHMIWDK